MRIDLRLDSLEEQETIRALIAETGRQTATKALMQAARERGPALRRARELETHLRQREDEVFRIVDLVKQRDNARAVFERAEDALEAALAALAAEG